MKLGKIGGRATAVLTIVGLVLFWQLAVAVMRVPLWLLPSPYEVFLSLMKNRAILGKHILATGTGALGGLAVGSVLAVTLAMLMVQFRVLEKIIMPLLLIDQSIPKLALAPIFVIWFGSGMLSRVVIATVISFFPMVVNTHRGLTTLDSRIGDMMHILVANAWQVMRKVRLPNAVPYIFAGLKVAVPLSLIGAVVAEFVQGDSGLGFLILIAVGNVDTPLVFVCVTLLAALSLTMFAVILITETVFLSRRFAYLVPTPESA